MRRDRTRPLVLAALLRAQAPGALVRPGLGGPHSYKADLEEMAAQDEDRLEPGKQVEAWLVPALQVRH